VNDKVWADTEIHTMQLKQSRWNSVPKALKNAPCIGLLHAEHVLKISTRQTREFLRSWYDLAHVELALKEETEVLDAGGGRMDADAEVLLYEAEPALLNGVRWLLRFFELIVVVGRVANEFCEDPGASALRESGPEV
jgi:hypothetical protein